MEMMGGDIIHGALGRRVQIPRLMIICNRPLDIVDFVTPVPVPEIVEGDPNLKYSAYPMTTHGTEIKQQDGNE
jgi:hypothetical protein